MNGSRQDERIIYKSIKSFVEGIGDSVEWRIEHSGKSVRISGLPGSLESSVSIDILDYNKFYLFFLRRIFFDNFCKTLPLFISFSNWNLDSNLSL